jgi:predicted transposase YbfD/YdcC
VSGQIKVDDQSNDITAIPKLIKLLDLAGATVTIDPMGPQKQIVKDITHQEADYVLALKETYPVLYEDVTLFFDDAQAAGFAEINHAYHEAVDGDYGRIEIRRYWITSAIEGLEAKGAWSNLQSIWMMESHYRLATSHVRPWENVSRSWNKRATGVLMELSHPLSAMLSTDIVIRIRTLRAGERNYRGRLLEKLQMRIMAELIHYAIQQRLVELYPIHLMIVS